MPDASDTAAVVREIHKAAGRGDAGRLRALLRRHPGLANDTLAPSGPTPLLTAAGYGRLACVTALLEAGSTVEAADNMHGTELHYAAMRGHAHCLPTLLAAGADVEAVNSQRRTPLGVAAHGGHAGCVRAPTFRPGLHGRTSPRSPMPQCGAARPPPVHCWRRGRMSMPWATVGRPPSAVQQAGLRGAARRACGC